MNKLKNFLRKNLSVKLKITIWYMFLMTGLVTFFLISILYLGNNVIRNNVYEYLKNGVHSSFSQIIYTDEGYIEIDNNLETLKGVIELSVYNKDKEFIYGNYSIDFDYEYKQFNNIGNFMTIKNGRDKWYVYEEVKHYPEYGNIWVRGVIKATLLDNIIQFIIKISIVALPIFLIFSGITGYIIIKNSLKPIDYIKNTAQEINAGNDLTKRINLSSGKNEVYTLAETFNNMFDKLKYSFDNEVQFTSDVSHELRTPVAVIKSQSEYGMTSIQNIDEAKNILKIIYDESTKMSNLISQLLTLARMEKGYQKLNFEFIDLSELVEIVCESQMENAKTKNITISYDIEESISTFIDENMIMRVFINLISNAITYGKENGFINVSLFLDKKQSMIISKITDDGIGISEENIDKIWVRFFQVDTSRTGDNSGLGLSMVKWIVEAHNGNISVESKINFGSTFTVQLPYRIDLD